MIPLPCHHDFCNLRDLKGWSPAISGNLGILQLLHKGPLPLRTCCKHEGQVHNSLPLERNDINADQCWILCWYVKVFIFPECTCGLEMGCSSMAVLIIVSHCTFVNMLCNFFFFSNKATADVWMLTYHLISPVHSWSKMAKKWKSCLDNFNFGLL